MIILQPKCEQSLCWHLASDFILISNPAGYRDDGQLSSFDGPLVKSLNRTQLLRQRWPMELIAHLFSPLLSRPRDFRDGAPV
jgi:hypothetical protein